MRLKQAAVLVLLEETTHSLILTERPSHLKEHPGELCFPGGRPHPDDSGLLATALRELEEELNILADRVYDTYPMHPVCTLTGYCISPWFGKIKQLEPFTMQESEVQRIVKIPFEIAQQQEQYRVVEVNKKGKHYRTLQLVYQTERVWGATAKVMQQLVLGIQH